MIRPAEYWFTSAPDRSCSASIRAEARMTTTRARSRDSRRPASVRNSPRMSTRTAALAPRNQIDTAKIWG